MKYFRLEHTLFPFCISKPISSLIEHETFLISGLANKVLLQQFSFKMFRIPTTKIVITFDLCFSDAFDDCGFELFCSSII